MSATRGEPKAFDLEYQEEIAWLQGQAMALVEQEPDAITLLQEQAHRQDAKFPSPDALPVPGYAEVWTWNYDIEIVQGIGHAPDVPCWCWELYRHNGRWPIDGCGGYASADEALSAALEVT